MASHFCPETFQLVRTLRQVSPHGDSFTPSGWPVTGPLAGPLRSVEGLHPPGIFNSNEKRILPSAAIRKRIHFGDWPVYCRLSTLIGNCATSGLPTNPTKCDHTWGQHASTGWSGSRPANIKTSQRVDHGQYQPRIRFSSSGVLAHRSTKPNWPEFFTSEAASRNPVIAAR